MEFLRIPGAGSMLKVQASSLCRRTLKVYALHHLISQTRVQAVSRDHRARKLADLESLQQSTQAGSRPLKRNRQSLQSLR